MRSSARQYPRRFLGEVGDDDVRAGAFETEQGFHDDGFAVEPAFFKGGAKHRVFAADLIDGEREGELLFGAAQHIEEGIPGLTMTKSAPSLMSSAISCSASLLFAGSIW